MDKNGLKIDFPAGWLTRPYAEQIGLVLPVVVSISLQGFADIGHIRDDKQPATALDYANVLAINSCQLIVSHKARVPYSQHVLNFITGDYGTVYIDQALWGVTHYPEYDQVEGVDQIPVTQEQMRDAAIDALKERLGTLPSAELLRQRVIEQEQDTRKKLLAGDAAMGSTLRADTPDEIQVTLIRLRLSGLNGHAIQLPTSSLSTLLGGVQAPSFATRQLFEA